MAAFLNIRLLKPLPIHFSGPQTKWRLELHYYGKGHNKASIIAICLGTGHAVLFHGGGRTATTESDLLHGIPIPIGTTQAKLATALVYWGHAEFYDPSAPLFTPSSAPPPPPA